MKKLKKIFIVYREGFEKKWWHRMAQVLICVSTIIFGGILLVDFSDNFKTQIYLNDSYYRYNYGCRYNSIEEQKNDIERFRSSQFSFLGNSNYHPNSSFIPAESMSCIKDHTYTKQTFFNNKELRNEFLGNIFLFIFSLLCWFVFWESIIYKLIIYIIYGKSK